MAVIKGSGAKSMITTKALLSLESNILCRNTILLSVHVKMHEAWYTTISGVLLLLFPKVRLLSEKATTKNNSTYSVHSTMLVISSSSRVQDLILAVIFIY